MHFFGTWGVHDCPDDKDLWILDNPLNEDVWGVVLDDGHEVVPCDNFVFDMATTKLVRAIWPQHWGRKSATHHDWGYHAHRTSAEELMLELTPWFDRKQWSSLERIEYINWIRNRPRAEWDRDFYVLTGNEKILTPLRKLGYYTIRLCAGRNWKIPRGNRTRKLREAGGRKSLYA